MVRSIKDLYKKVKDVKATHPGYHVPSNEIDRSSLRGGSTISIEYYGGPSTGSPNVRAIRMTYYKYSSYATWRVNVYNDKEVIKADVAQDCAIMVKPIVDLIMKEVNVRELFNELYRGALVQMVAKLPVYAAVMSKFKLVEDFSAGTLYVTFNPIMLSYEIHYNPQFIVETMVTHACSCYFYNDDQLVDELTGYTALMFSHEMEHVLRSNLGAGGEIAEALEGVNPGLLNLVSDSLINQKLMDIYMDRYPSVGIVSNFHSTVILPKDVVGKGDLKFATLIADAGYHFKGFNHISKPEGRSKSLIKDKVGKIIFNLKPDIIDFYKDNSNELVRDIDNFIKAISGTASIDELGEMLQGSMEDLSEAISKSSGNIKPSRKIESPNGNASQSGAEGSGESSHSSSISSAGASSSSSTSGSSKSSSTEGSQESKEDSSSGGSGSSGESSTEGSGAGGGEGSLKPKDIGSMSDQEKELAKKALSDIINGASVPKLTDEENQKVETLRKITPNLEEKVKGVMKSADAAIVQKVNTGTTVSTWKRSFGRLLAQCLGIKEVYSNEVPSARIEGAFGREEEVPDLKTLVIALDCSGSMGPDKFKKIFKEIETICKAVRSNSLEVKVVYWGSSAYLYKTKGTKTLMTKIQSNSKDMGGTNFNAATEFMIKKTPRFDALLVMTDGEFFSEPAPNVKAFIAKNKRKIIWVLTPGARTTDIVKYDPTCKQRVIKQQ